jgi:CHAD domain-containing protein
MAVRAVLRHRLDALIDALPPAARGDAAAVHHARVATRRVRAALPLLAGPSKRKLERAMRRVARALGPLRELDVTLGIVDDLASSRTLPRPAAVALRQAIGDDRDRLRDAVARELADVDLDKLRKRALAAVERQDGQPSGEARLHEARLRAARRAERLRDAIESAAGMYLPDRLHDVRIAVKKLRYAMEVVAELRRSRARARIRALKSAQDLLGRMHDLEVLIARTRAVQGSPNAPNLRMSAALDVLVRRLENECRQLHGQYMATRPTLLAICDHVRADGVARHRPAA